MSALGVGEEEEPKIIILTLQTFRNVLRSGCQYLNICSEEGIYPKRQKIKVPICYDREIFEKSLFYCTVKIVSQYFQLKTSP